MANGMKIDSVKNPMDAIFDGCRTVSDIAYSLECLAGAFYETGNERMAKTLNRMSVDLSHAETDIRQGYGREITERTAAAEASARATVEVLVGTAMGRGDVS